MQNNTNHADCELEKVSKQNVNCEKKNVKTLHWVVKIYREFISRKYVPSNTRLNPSRMPFLSSSPNISSNKENLNI